MPVLTADRSIIAIVVMLQFFGIAAGAANMPLPDRNPLRVAAMPLPERNPIRDAGLPLPERNPNRVGPEAETAHASPPDVKADTKADEKPGDAAAAKPDPNKWSDEETAAERARCEVMLKDLPVVTEPDDPVRQGECGAVAPVTLISVGKDPEVRLVPPATVTCDMVAAMARWIEKDVQPAARKVLGAPITRMNIIGHYSCRHALGRITKRLSEHGVANALDIRDFVTERGETADLIRDWGPTARDIAAEAAAEAERKAAAAAAAVAAEAAKKAAKEAKDAASKESGPKAGQKIAKLAATKPDPPRLAVTTGNASAEARGRPLSRSEIRRAQRDARRRGGSIHQVVHTATADAGIGRPDPVATSGKKSPAARLTAPLPEDEKPSPRRQFLRQIHAKACGTFGTVLGPEANEAHRNHFHVDMAKRRHRSFCE
jgi:hypothetical protein